jgi:hypothetical protein
MQSFGGAKPVVSNANSKNRRSHNTAERINCISKVLHVLEPPLRETQVAPVKSSPHCLCARF